MRHGPLVALVALLSLYAVACGGNTVASTDAGKIELTHDASPRPDAHRDARVVTDASWDAGSPTDASALPDVAALDGPARDTGIRTVDLPGVCKSGVFNSPFDAGILGASDASLDDITNEGCSPPMGVSQATVDNRGEAVELNIACCAGLVCDTSISPVCVIPNCSPCSTDGGAPCVPIVSQCDPVAHTCAALTCVSSNGFCDGPLSALPCCDHAAVCGGDDAGDGNQYCCYPGGTVIPDGGVANCCSGFPSFGRCE